MNKKAVAQARIEFNRATDSIDALRASNRREEIETHWSNFLTAADRVFTKLKQGTKLNPESKLWFSQTEDRRRSDPLLCYIWKARNADQHTIIEITEHRPGGIREVTPTPEETENFRRTVQKRQMPLNTKQLVLEHTLPHTRLLPVVDRGKTYYPPPSPCLLPFNAGMLALSKLDAILQEAEALDGDKRG